MTTRLVSASVLVLALALGSPAGAAPKATKYQTTMTSPTTATGATIKITKTSKLALKASAGSITISLKLRGVTDNLDLPVTLANNTLQVDVLVSGAFCTLMFTTVNIEEGKATQKFPIANGSVPCVAGLAVGQAMEIRGGRVVQNGTGQVFAVTGVTAR